MYYITFYEKAKKTYYFWGQKDKEKSSLDLKIKKINYENTLNTLI